MQHLILKDVESTQKNVAESISTFGALGYVSKVIELVRRNSSLICAIHNGVGRIKPEDNEDPAEILKELRETYRASVDENDEVNYFISEFTQLMNNIETLDRQLEVIFNHNKI